MKTTAKHFKVFKKEVEKWIPLLGIMDWSVVIEHKACPKGESNLAYGYISYCNKSCVLCLSKDWTDNKISNIAIKRCGFHETAHVFFYPMEERLLNRGYSQDEVDKLIHGYIYVFENILFGIGE